MTSQDFCYWLNGYFELRREEVGLSDKQVDVIKEHLGLVFNKVTVKQVSNPKGYDIGRKLCESVTIPPIKDTLVYCATAPNLPDLSCDTNFNLGFMPGVSC